METVLSSPIGVASRDAFVSGVKTLSCEMLSDVDVGPADNWFLLLQQKEQISFFNDVMNEHITTHE